MENDSNKKMILSIIGVAILVLLVVGISFAFFYYTFTGTKNNILQVGSISFIAEDTQMNLNNAFPVSSTIAEEATTSTTDVGVATVTITGKTTYAKGIDFTVTVVDINSNLDPKVPISLIISDPTGENSAGVSVSNKATKLGENGSTLFTGHVDPVSTANYATTNTSAVISIKAYVDTNDVIISDTDTAEPPTQVISTINWSAKTLTFKVKVTATQGE